MRDSKIIRHSRQIAVAVALRITLGQTKAAGFGRFLRRSLGIRSFVRALGEVRVHIRATQRQQAYAEYESEESFQHNGNSSKIKLKPDGSNAIVCRAAN